jgi:membrane protein HdeD
LQKNVMALILIVLGLIILVCPMLGLVPLSWITGFTVIIVGLGLLVAGISEMGESKGAGIAGIILGIIALILGIGFIVNPGLFSWLVGFIVWVVGLFLVIAGIIGIISKAGGSRWNGVIAFIFGIIYLIVGNLIADPVILGALIGLWLLVTGILMLFMKE